MTDPPPVAPSGGDPDAIIIGSGPNGLVAACRLAATGRRVLVLEGHPTRAGGAVASEAATRPGFIHDVGAGFFPFSQISPAFQALGLERHGLRWARAEVESAHPAPDGSVASICADLDATCASFGGRDGDRWRRVFSAWRRAEPRLIAAMLGPLPGLGPKLRLGPINTLRFLRVALSSAGRLANGWFQGEAARRVMPGLGLHVDLGPDDPFGAALGYVLAMTAGSGGNRVPVGGAGAITAALVRALEANGGQVRLGARVTRILTRGGRGVGVRLADGEEIATRGPILANTAAAALYLELLADTPLPARVGRVMRRFPQAWGTFKVDYALSGPVPWLAEEARRAAVVHAGDSLDDLRRFTAEVRSGALPTHPYLVVGQQSLPDPTRAPPGQHTLWVYTRVPPKPEGGWAACREALADRIDQRLEGLAPGFREQVQARHLVTPEDLQAFDPNLIGGDLGGGSNAWHNQLIFRPMFPYFRYRTPVRGVYLCSSYAHPGAGVHGMCGHNAAAQALRDG